ncbi:uncharacterized protein LOC113790580 [Dermatophagoides pteronyssinus]|uniref:uncharacterized protein LOC113790580 n=1 Tax=Dermatophagoides pteronyssinus TaxID=6956 RepID=UPI003F667976
MSNFVNTNKISTTTTTNTTTMTNLFATPNYSSSLGMMNPYQQQFYNYSSSSSIPLPSSPIQSQSLPIVNNNFPSVNSMITSVPLAQAGTSTMPPSTPIISPQHQSWSQNIPSVMPWSNQLNNQSINERFSFGIMPSPLPSSQISQPIQQPQLINNQQLINNSIAPSNQNINANKKRHFSHLINDSEDESFYDFDNERPIKKYIGEDKVLEIFDRMHIREGENYIVEDVKDVPLIDSNNNNNGILIEEIDDNNNISTDTGNVQILEISPELRDAFSNQQPSITDKLIQAEQEKISKALVVWESNSLMNLLSGNNRSEIDSDDDDDNNNNVRIEEPSDTDLDDQMVDEDDDDAVIILETDCKSNPIETYKNYIDSIQDQPME